MAQIVFFPKPTVAVATENSAIISPLGTQTVAASVATAINGPLGVQTASASLATNINGPLGQTTKSASIPVVLASDQGILFASPAGLADSEFYRLVYSTTNVTTSAYVQIVASTVNTAQAIYISDTSGQTLKIAFGAPGSEVDQLSVNQGGPGLIPKYAAGGTRISIKALSATANTGEFNIIIFGI